MSKTSNIGRTARRIRELMGNTTNNMSVGYTFTIVSEDETNGYWREANGNAHLIKNCELVENAPTRTPIKPGTHGIVQIFASPISGASKIGVDIRIAPIYATADELREAAHLFNQLAEQLEDSAKQQAQPQHNNPDAPTPTFNHGYSAELQPGGLWSVFYTSSGGDRYPSCDGFKTEADAVAWYMAQPAYSPPPAPADDTPVMGNVASLDKAYRHAVRLLEALAAKHVKDSTFKPLDTLAGVLDQIDNITAGLVKPSVPMPDYGAPHRFERAENATICKHCFNREDHPRHAVTVLAEANDAPMSRAEIRKLVRETVASAMQPFMGKRV